MSGINVRRSDWKDIKFIVYCLLPFLALALYVVCSYIWSIQANVHHWVDVVRWGGIGGMSAVFVVLSLITEHLARRRLDILHSQIAVSLSDRK